MIKDRTLEKIGISVVFTVAGVIGLVPGFVTGNVMLSLASAFGSGDSPLSNAFIWGIARIVVLVVGMACYGGAVASAANPLLWRNIWERGFGSKPHLQALSATLLGGLGFGIVVASAFTSI